MGRRKKLKAGKKKKRVLVKLMEREHEGQVVHPYRILEETIDQHHPHLRDAKIALAWRYGWKTDRDGWLKLGQAKKASDLDRDLHHFDFVILLNHEVWNVAEFTEPQMRALIDHELCHCEIVREDGEPKTDDFGRKVYRIRKHDIEEFNEIISRHGLWKADLEKFAKLAVERSKAPLLRMTGTDATVATPGKITKQMRLPPGDEDAPLEKWRATSLDDLGILDKPAEALAAANVTTLGAITDCMAAKALTAIAGITAPMAREIENAVHRYWKDHPKEAEVAAVAR